MGLDDSPEFDSSSEIAGQSQSGVGADSASAVTNFVDAHGRNADILGHLVLANDHRFLKFFEQNFAGLNALLRTAVRPDPCLSIYGSKTSIL